MASRFTVIRNAESHLASPRFHSCCPVLLTVVILVFAWREGQSTEHLSCLRCAKSYKLSNWVFTVIINRLRQAGGSQNVDHFHQFVGISALISIGAHGRGHGEDFHGPVFAYSAGKIAAAIGSWIERSRIIGDAVGHADVEPVLQHI